MRARQRAPGQAGVGAVAVEHGVVVGQPAPEPGHASLPGAHEVWVRGQTQCVGVPLLDWGLLLGRSSMGLPCHHDRRPLVLIAHPYPSPPIGTRRRPHGREPTSILPPGSTSNRPEPTLSHMPSSAGTAAPLRLARACQPADRGATGEPLDGETMAGIVRCLRWPATPVVPSRRREPAAHRAARAGHRGPARLCENRLALH
jgi:hypothetical protein